MAILDAWKADVTTFTLEELHQQLVDVRKALPFASNADVVPLMRRCTVIELEIGGRRLEIDRLDRAEREIRAYVANRIRAARALRAMTQAGLADALGMSQATLSNIEKARREVRVTELIRIAVITRQPLAFFTYPVHEPEPQIGWEHAFAD